MSAILDPRAFWGTAPPEPRSRLTNWPTVLFSWWCTTFAAVIIVTRVLGRKVRSNKLFREDWIMVISLIPLFIRMVFIHFVLIYGTNNIDTTHHIYTDRQIYEKTIGSRLVLVARIFYAMFIWFCKLSVSEFLKRITIRVWRRSWERTLQFIRVFLFATFGAVVIATLTECQPFDHYWQVVPDPGPHCRQGFAQLLTMGTCDIITDVLLIGFPIPVVMMSGQTWKRKLQMVSLFSLSAIMIAVTATRMPQVIMRHGRQQYRTVWASCEILASAAVSSSVILGSFLRDKGTKKNKFRSYSVSDSIERPSTRRPTMATIATTESDEDLFRSVGLRIPDHLQDHTMASPRPAPPALPAAPSHRSDDGHPTLPPFQTKAGDRPSDSSEDSMKQPGLHQALPSPAPSTARSLSFFDVGNLLDEESRVGSSRSYHYVDSGNPYTEAQDFATAPGHFSQGSRQFLRDVGGILSDVKPPHFHRREGRDRESTRRSGDGRRTAPIGVLGPMLERHETQLSLQDAGGLLHTGSDSFTNDDSTSHATHAVHCASPSQRLAPHEEAIELEDIGGLLSDRRRAMDRGAMSLQAVLPRDGSCAFTRDATTVAAAMPL